MAVSNPHWNPQPKEEVKPEPKIKRQKRDFEHVEDKK